MAGSTHAAHHARPPAAGWSPSPSGRIASTAALALRGCGSERRCCAPGPRRSTPPRTAERQREWPVKRGSIGPRCEAQGKLLPPVPGEHGRRAEEGPVGANLAWIGRLITAAESDRSRHGEITFGHGADRTGANQANADFPGASPHRQHALTCRKLQSASSSLGVATSSPSNLLISLSVRVPRSRSLDHGARRSKISIPDLSICCWKRSRAAGIEIISEQPATKIEECRQGAAQSSTSKNGNTHVQRGRPRGPRR